MGPPVTSLLLLDPLYPPLRTPSNPGAIVVSERPFSTAWHGSSSHSLQ